MYILPISFNFNLNTIQPKTQRVGSIDASVSKYANIRPLSVDTVSFTGSVPNATSLRKLLSYGVPDFYSDIILFDPEELKRIMGNHLFSGKLKTIVKYLQKYKQCLFPVEKQVFNLMRNESKRHPNRRLDEFIHHLVPQHSQKLLRIQQPIFDKLTILAQSMPSDLLSEFDYLMYITQKKLSNAPVYVPFSIKEFKYKLGRIKERIVKSKDATQQLAFRKIERMAAALPEYSKEKRLSKDFPIKKYERNQVNLVLDIADFVEKSALRNDKDLQNLIEISKAQVFKTPTNIKFNRKTFIYDLQKILDKLSDKKLARRMNQLAVSLPTSKDNLSAFIVKSADRSAQQIGFDLLQGSLGTVDHLLASKKGGKDCIENYVLSSAHMNSKKAHQRFIILLRNNPEVRVYSQRQMDRLIELANKGVFRKVDLSKNYIDSIAYKVKTLTSKDTPLILDTNALKY